jgi:hypothetical protein
MFALHNDILIEVLQLAIDNLTAWSVLQTVCHLFRACAQNPRTLMNLKLQIKHVANLRHKCAMVKHLSPFNPNQTNIKLLAYLPRLQFLEVRGVSPEVEGDRLISDLACLKCLRLVQFCSSSIHTLLQRATFEELEELYLYNCKQFGTPTMKLLNKFLELRTLELHHLKFDSSALLSLGSLSHLRHFTMVNNSTVKNLEFVKAWRHLETLRLNGCRGLSDINAIQDLVELHTLDLDHCFNVQNIDSNVACQIATLKNFSARNVPCVMHKIGIVYF